MNEDFKLPAGLRGRFGVIKLWPDIQVAEDEVIARLVNAASLLGLDCVVLDHMGRRLKEGGAPLTGKDLDFVIHLHFSTPKSYDIFSFLTLWNPTAFLHDFGYRPMAENMLTHDDYLSCRSPGADLHLRRLIHGGPTHLPPKFELFHSLATPILPPEAGEWNVFYMGINWERLGQGGSRHQSVLNLLDEAGMLRIYGPDELRGVKVWEGFKSYQRPLPFDGVSVIEEVHRAGICLALSSQPHKDAALMSNRLFEGLAAGAVIICDENPWARTHFGDTLLYVDLRDDAETVAGQIVGHVRWARANPAAAVALAGRAQDIFKSTFIMSRSLGEIYAGLTARKQELASLWRDKLAGASVRVVCLVPDPAGAEFGRQVEAALRASRQGFRATLLVDRADFDAAADRIRQAGTGIEVEAADFFQRDSAGRVVLRNRLGGVLRSVFLAAPDNTLLCFVAPNETLFEDHVAMLAGLLQSRPELDYAWTKAIIRRTDDTGESSFAVEHSLDLLSGDLAAPIGLARFMFRASAFAIQLENLLESLDVRAASGLAFHATGDSTQRASLIIDARGKTHLDLLPETVAERKLGAEVVQDLEAIRDLDVPRFDAAQREAQLRAHMHQLDDRNRQSNNILHKAFHDLHSAFHDLHSAFIAIPDQKTLVPNALYLNHLSPSNLRGIVIDLLRGLPLPRPLRRIARACLHGLRWLRQRA